MTTPTPEPLTRERLRSLRMICGLTLQQMAGRLGYDPQHYGRIERGTYPVPADMRERLRPILRAHMEDVSKIVRDL